jgi:hypothetical protein
MPTERNEAAARRFHDAFNAGDLGGVDELTIQDTNWALSSTLYKSSEKNRRR